MLARGFSRRRSLTPRRSSEISPVGTVLRRQHRHAGKQTFRTSQRVVSGPSALYFGTSKGDLAIVTGARVASYSFVSLRKSTKGGPAMSANPEDLVDRIYNAAAFPDEWPSVLLHLEQLVGGVCTALLTRRADEWAGWKHTPLGAALHDQWMSSGAAANSRSTAALVQLKRAGFVGSHEVMDDHEWDRDPLLAEVGAPAGFHRAAATAIFIPNGDSAIVHIWRRAGAPRFSKADLRRLDQFRPHLARSAMLAARWRLERVRAAAQALEIVGLPTAIVDAAGRVLAANSILQAMRDHIAWLPGNRVALHDPGAGALLKSTLEEAFSRGQVTGRSFAAQGLHGAEPVVVHVVPLSGQGRELFDGGLLMLALNPIGADAPDATLLQGLFDLTAAEARVATALIEGLSANDVSRLHGVSVATVRSQIRGVLTKSGVSRQSEFAAKLRGLSRGRIAGRHPQP